MNKTRIEWTDFTFNPVTGCWGPGGTAEKPKRCAYCYANRIAGRFLPPRKIYRQGQGTFEDDFSPIFWPERLSQPAKVKKPSKIFVCSMADLFGDWVPDEWIEQVKVEAIHCPHHIFQFLTKNPKRLKDFNPWPGNCWVGTTATNQADMDERGHWLLKVNAPVRFVSHEPLLGNIYLPRWTSGKWTLRGHNHPTEPGRGINWAIIGAMTGPGAVRPDPEWVQGLVDQYLAASVPFFLKDNLDLDVHHQEFPQ
jgi:protein gp37